MERSLLRHLSETSSSRIALGHLFLEGLAEFLKAIKDGSDHKVLCSLPRAQLQSATALMSAAHRSHIESAVLHLRKPRKETQDRYALEFEEQLRKQIAFLEQTKENEQLIETLFDYLESEVLSMRWHSKEPVGHQLVHLKYDDDSPDAIFVSSHNQTMPDGVADGLLKYWVTDSDTTSEAKSWFDALWRGSHDMTVALGRLLDHSWCRFAATPYDVFMKSIYALAENRIRDDKDDVLWDDDIVRDLAEFQRVAVKHAIQIIRQFNGVFISDVVGLGKSFIGAAITRFFTRVEKLRPMVVCPASLVNMWEDYNAKYDLNAQVVSIGKISQADAETISFFDDVRYRNCNFVLVDESHNFRNRKTNRYQQLEEFLASGDKRCCFLTATPRNKSGMDIYHQLKLFHQDDVTTLPINPPDLRRFFQLAEKKKANLQEVLSAILIRRTRRDILKWYGYDADTNEPLVPSEFHEYWAGDKRAYVKVGKSKQFFPRRQLATIDYNIDNAYSGFYQSLRETLGGKDADGEKIPKGKTLSYARYNLGSFLLDKNKDLPEFQGLASIGRNLSGLIRVLLFKRLESSVHAFRETVRRIHHNHDQFLKALEGGIVPAGQDAQDILNSPNDASNDEQDLIKQLKLVDGTYKSMDFEQDRLREALESDLGVLAEILVRVDAIAPEDDDKLQELKRRLSSDPLNKGKCLVFTEYADTALYLGENLSEYEARGVITSAVKDRMKMVERFSPMSNSSEHVTPAEELDLLIATDVLSEGLNLQDADKIVNYDLHWNPVRLIQRFGRIDRIGSQNEYIYGFNFLPTREIEQALGLKEILKIRIAEIHQTIGEDFAILDPAEKINEKSMYAIYDSDGDFSEAIEDDLEGAFDMNEAAELLRSMKEQDPDEFNRIQHLPDGIRSTLITARNELFVHCRVGDYQQVMLVDSKGNIVSRDINKVLGAIRCNADTPRVDVPDDFSDRVHAVYRQFSDDAEKRARGSNRRKKYGVGQRYILDELNHLLDSISDDDKIRVGVLRDSFDQRLPLAVIRDLNRMRTAGMSGQHLLSELTSLYHDHDLASISDPVLKDTIVDAPQIVCCEFLQ